MDWLIAENALKKLFYETKVAFDKNTNKITYQSLIDQMALYLYSRRRTDFFTRLHWVFQLMLVLAVIAISEQDSWGPYITNWRCERMASQLSEQYGLIVRYGDPSEFYFPPKTRCADKSGLSVKTANPHSALIALKGIRAALKKYPEKLLHQYLEAVFIAGMMKNYGSLVLGTYFQSWIYISATPAGDSYGPQTYEETLHHELSSLFMNGDETIFLVGQWCAANATDFKYFLNISVKKYIAAIENREDPSNAPLWYKAGFVSDYGKNDIENDFNTYAELAMTEPEKLKRLAEQYPRIREKTRILADFYSGLAPELKAYFVNTGLAGSGRDEPS